MNEQFGEKVKAIFDSITVLQAKDSDLKRDNANINGDSPMGAMLQYGANTAKEYNLEYLIKPAIAELHRDGWIHIHDLDFYAWTTTCTQIELRKLFKNGFNTGHGHLRAPKSIGSYAALAAIAIQSNQNDQHGGQSVVDFDYAMAEGVRYTYQKYLKEGYEICERLNDLKDKAWILDYAMEKTTRDTYQAMEGFIHNLNTMHSRAGAQVPFSSINYGTDTSWEGRLAIEQLLLATEAGLGHGETPIFPIQIFRVKEGVNYNPDDPNYDLFKLAMKVSADARDISSDTEDGTLSDAEYMAQLRTKGLKNLADHIVTTAFEGEVEVTRLFKYGEDFFIGDIVQIANEYGNEGSAYISELVISNSEEGLSIYPTFKTISK